MFDATAGLPEQVGGGRRGRPGSAGPARRRGDRARRGVRHGRQRHRRRRPGGGRRTAPARARSSSSSPTSAPRSWARHRSSSPSRARATPRRRSQAATDAALQGAKVVAITCGRRAGPPGRRVGAPRSSLSPSTFPSPAPPSGRMSVPALVVLEQMGLLRGAGHWIGLAVDQLRRRRDQLVGGRRASAAAADRPADRPDLAADPRWRARSAPPPPSAGRPRSTRTPRRRRSGAPSPSCATTRSAGGASTATSPAS